MKPCVFTEVTERNMCYYISMEKRSAARDLAFLAIFQLPRKSDKIDPEKLARTDLDALCLSAIRTLADHAKDNMKAAEAYFIKTERYLMEYQINHEINEELESGTRGVPVPLSDEFVNHLNNCYQSINLLREAIQIPEMYWHYHDEMTKNFAIDLLLSYIKHREEAQALIAELSQSWRIERIHKIDRILLELAASELLASDLPAAVVVTEAIKLANKYSSEESVKFINGILSDIIKKLFPETAITL